MNLFPYSIIIKHLRTLNNGYAINKSIQEQQSLREFSFVNFTNILFKKLLEILNMNII